MLNIKKTEFYLESLLLEIGLIYDKQITPWEVIYEMFHIMNCGFEIKEAMILELHHRKCFVRILFTRCKTLEAHLFVSKVLRLVKKNLSPHFL